MSDLEALPTKAVLERSTPRCRRRGCQSLAVASVLLATRFDGDPEGAGPTCLDCLVEVAAGQAHYYGEPIHLISAVML